MVMENKQNNHQLLCDKYIIDKEIGKGSFATVYKGTCISYNEQHNGDDNDDRTDTNGGGNDSFESAVAIKAVSKSKLKNKKLLENLEIEIAILKKIQHPHIVRLIDCQRTSTDFYLIMEYCSLGDLTFLIKKKNELIKTHPIIKLIFKKFPSPSEKHNGLNRILIVNYLQQLSSSLKFLRSKNLVHRDIKPQNLLLSTPLVAIDDILKHKQQDGFVGLTSLPILKIADFGFARFLPNTALAETLCGSPLYMAPEILNYQKYNAKADLWSVGTVLYEMCCGRPPFKASNHLELYKKIKKANDIIQFPIDVEIEDELKNLICSLLTFDPVDRLNFNEFFNNKLVNEDLSMYDLDDKSSVDGLKKSKEITNNNLFISEYIENNQKKIMPIDKTNSSEKKKIMNPQINNSEIILEKDYVVIEKKTVEVNAFADEVADNNTKYLTKLQTNKTGHSPKNITSAATNNIMLNNQILPQANQRSPRNSIPNTTTIATANNSPPNPLTNTNSSRRASLIERRISISSLNPSNALSKAIGTASTKLFGSNTNNTLSNNAHHKNTAFLNPQLYHDLTENIVLRAEQYNSNNGLVSDTLKTSDLNSIVHQIESLSAKAFVVYSYAEIKYSQVMPARLSLSSMSSNSEKVTIPETNADNSFKNNNTIKLNVSPNSHEYKYEDNDDMAVDLIEHTINKQSAVTNNLSTNIGTSDGVQRHNSFTFTNDLSQKEIQLLSTEAIVLYMKALSILAEAMSITSKWWYESNDKNCSLRLNLLVQWIRDTFNESLGKADFLRLKLLQFTEHSNSISDNDVTTDNQSKIEHNENYLDDKIYLEKLLYDRALDISKTAAKMELQGENLSNCELAYATSIWMLQVLLEEGATGPETNIPGEDNFSMKSSSLTNSQALLDEKDREIIKKYIESIANRLKSLRNKMNQN
ncbi:hypothetical protein TPHA_0H00410 [Tetrapisispora phaffii CBS 4417]|uniref:Serine/threonine-protein kinase ATG1 n=1 Tax=Tetrapisispora phaffii (strain ATCC 24235 / CBS 4417 / NBRC 1672 / NRRL Y-8282 / UCD 70-5) TaxID=1071381 RepID=G8BWU7_TETPH|nr:hypothetical protein TPHA_0H00410 [Tetrapisispora phaffii CBS 4417]CCE64251.1 hypothetical protein TPHA_0H00410 [Tetrapisispora phaffii CBS 4417]